MKHSLALLIAVGALACAQAQPFVLWDFNSAEEDFEPATGTLEPVIGTGSCEVIGGATFAFAATNSPAPNSDPSADNSSLRTASYPPQGSGNKTRGVEFRFSTVGYENIQATWDQRNAPNSSRYWRIQYTLDGETWNDHTVLTNTVVDAWRNGYGVADFRFIPGAANNANFGFRIVIEFQSTAAGHGSRGYVIANTVSGSYSASQQVWFDMVSVTGTPLDPANSYPTISPIANQPVPKATLETQPFIEIPFTVNDAEAGPEGLWMDVKFSNPLVINNHFVGGAGANRTLHIAPKSQVASNITVWVIAHDPGGKQNSSAFSLDIYDPDYVPTQLPFTLADFEAEIFEGRANATVLFRLPNFSGDNVGVAAPNIAMVTNIAYLPTGAAANTNLGQRVINVRWSFSAGDGAGYLRLRTFPPNTAFLLGNPIISFEHPFAFDIYTEEPLQICLLLRETNSEGEYGTDGLASGSVKWIGGSGVYNSGMSVSNATPVPAKEWVRMVFDIPAMAQDAVPRTGSGPLFSTTGKGTLEALGFVGQRGVTHNVYFDNFTILPAAAPLVPLAIALNNGNVEISWPASANGLTLERTSTLNPPDWQTATEPVVVVGDRNTVTIPATGSGVFFRLTQ
jgi:hypothetical protein